MAAAAAAAAVVVSLVVLEYAVQLSLVLVHHGCLVPPVVMLYQLHCFSCLIGKKN